MFHIGHCKASILKQSNTNYYRKYFTGTDLLLLAVLGPWKIHQLHMINNLNQLILRMFCKTRHMACNSHQLIWKCLHRIFHSRFLQLLDRLAFWRILPNNSSNFQGRQLSIQRTFHHIPCKHHSHPYTDAHCTMYSIVLFRSKTGSTPRFHNNLNNQIVCFQHMSSKHYGIHSTVGPVSIRTNENYCKASCNILQDCQLAELLSL